MTLRHKTPRPKVKKLFSELVPDPDAPVIGPKQFINYYYWIRGEQIEKKLFSHKINTIIGGPTQPPAGRGKPQMLSFKDAVLVLAGADLNNLLQWPARTRMCVSLLRANWDAFLGDIWKEISEHFDMQPDNPEKFRGFPWSHKGKQPVLLLGFRLVDTVDAELFKSIRLVVDPSEPISALWEGETWPRPQIVYNPRAVIRFFVDKLAAFLIYEEEFLSVWPDPL